MQHAFLAGNYSKSLALVSSLLMSWWYFLQVVGNLLSFGLLYYSKVRGKICWMYSVNDFLEEPFVRICWER